MGFLARVPLRVALGVALTVPLGGSFQVIPGFRTWGFRGWGFGFRGLAVQGFGV